MLVGLGILLEEGLELGVEGSHVNLIVKFLLEGLGEE